MTWPAITPINTSEFNPVRGDQPGRVADGTPWIRSYFTGEKDVSNIRYVLTIADRLLVFQHWHLQDKTEPFDWPDTRFNPAVNKSVFYAGTPTSSRIFNGAVLQPTQRFVIVPLRVE